MKTHKSGESAIERNVKCVSIGARMYVCVFCVQCAQSKVQTNQAKLYANIQCCHSQNIRKFTLATEK